MAITNEERRDLALAAHDRGVMLDFRIKSICSAIEELEAVVTALAAERVEAFALMESLQ